MFWTKEKIYLTRRKPTQLQFNGSANFGRTSSNAPYLESIIDFIPLHEIESIDDSEEVNSAASRDKDMMAKLFEPFATQKKSHARLSISGLGNQKSMIKIKTEPDGFNSGRTYYVRVKSDLQSVAASKLCAIWRSAKQSKEAVTRFKKNQEFVRKIYTSAPSQYMIAALISTVKRAVQ